MKKFKAFNELMEQGRKRKEILENSSKLTEVLESAIKTNNISLSYSTIKEIEERSKKIDLIINNSSFVNLAKVINQIDGGVTALAAANKAFDVSTFSSAVGTLNVPAFPTALKNLEVSAFTPAVKTLDVAAFPTSLTKLDLSALAFATKALDTSAFNQAVKALDMSVFNQKIKIPEMSAFASAVKALDISAFKSVSDTYGTFFNSVSPISKIYLSELAKIKSNIGTLAPKDIINSPVFIEAKNVQSELVKFEPSIGILPITTLEKLIESEDKGAFEKVTKEIKSIEIAEQIKVSNSDIPLLEANPYKNNRIDVLIITGLPLELLIFRGIFKVNSRWASDKFVAEYWFGSVESDNKKYSVALAFGEDMGNFHASQITNAAIDDLNPKIVISAGIGYTLNPTKLQLCDLHITDSIVFWGLTSKEYGDGNRKVRANSVRVRSNHTLQEMRKYVDGLITGKTSFAKWAKDAEQKEPKTNAQKVDEVLSAINIAVNCGKPTTIFNKQPKVEIGKTMVSDDVVIASADEIRKRSLFDAGNESYISGEMEAAGVAMALANRRAPIEFIAVRGISDFGFGKEALESSSKEFRLIAATRAGTFIKSFLESDPTLPKPDVGVACKLGVAIK